MFLRYKYNFLIILSTILLLLISFIIGIYYSSHQIVSSQMSTYFFEALSIVLTEYKYGFDGYQGKLEIFNFLKPFSSKIDHINKAIDYVLKNDFTNNNSYHLLHVSEIGYVDFIRHSFFLFGFKLSSIYFLFYLILLVSIILFIFSEYNNPLHLLLLLLVVFSISLVLISFVSTDSFKDLLSEYNIDRAIKITSINNVRALSILGIIPSLGLLIYLTTNEKFNIIKFIIFILQLLLVLYLIRCRTHLIWFVIPPTIYLIYLFLKKIYFLYIKKNKIHTNIYFFTLNYLIILFLLISTFSLDKQIKNKIYFESYNLYNHSPAFSFVIGILIENKFREKYTGYKRIPEKDFFEEHRCKFNPDSEFCNIANISFLRPLAQKLHKMNIEIHNYDVDGYSAAFKWLERNNRSYYELFSFDEEDNINFVDYFYPFIFKKDKIKTKSNNLKEFEFTKHFKFYKVEEINRYVIKDMFINEPFSLIKISLIYKPLLYLKNVAFNFILLNDFRIVMISMFFLIILFLIFINRYINFDLKLRSQNTILIVSFLIGSLSQNVYGSIHSQVIHDSNVCFLFFILYCIQIFILKIRKV